MATHFNELTEHASGGQALNGKPACCRMATTYTQMKPVIDLICVLIG